MAFARARLLPPFALALSAFACSRSAKEPPRAEAPPSDAVTYHGHVKPLLDARCVACHSEGQVAFSLADEAAVYDKRSQVVDAVAGRRMPVWLAAAGHERYRDDVSLTDAEIALVERWRDGGFLRGEPEATPSTPPAGAALRDLDADVTLPVLPAGQAYEPDQRLRDEYRCFVIDWPHKDRVRYMTGFQAVPGNRAIVHHLVAYEARPEAVPMLRQLDEEEAGAGYRCFGGAYPDRLADPAVRARVERDYPGVLGQRGWNAVWLGHWAPGMRGHEFPPGVGVPIHPGSAVVVQVHFYTRTAPGAAEQGSEVRFSLADAVEKPAFILPLSKDDWLDARHNRSLVVPAGGELTVHHEMSVEMMMRAGQAILREARPVTRLEIHSANLHMHSYGQQATTWLTTGGSSERDVLLEIPRWDLAWQRDYTFAEPKVFTPETAKGAALHVECRFANRTGAEVVGGYGSDEEMCFDFSLVALGFGE